MSKRSGRSDFVLFPGVIIVDTREILPYQFAGLLADAKHEKKPFIVRTQRKALPSGDYSLIGCDKDIAIERKSLPDAFQTFGKDRERFERELERLNLLQYSAVIIEADWSNIFSSPPQNSQLSPKSVFRSVIAWQQRFTRVHFWAVPGRAFAERLTFRILERFLRDKLALPDPVPVPSTEVVDVNSDVAPASASDCEEL